MKKTTKIFLLSVVIAFGIFTVGINQSTASFLCPPQYHCALVADVISGKDECPKGYTCLNVPAAMDCPPLDTCFLLVKQAGVIATSTTKGAFTSTALLITSLDHYSGSAGSTVIISGKNFTSSIVVLITSPTTLPVSVLPNLIASSTSGADTATFIIPQYIAAGKYSFSVKSLAGLVSNTADFTVTALTSGAQTPNQPPISNTPNNTTNNNNNNTYIPPASNPYYNNTPNTVPPYTQNGKFVTNDRIQTTDNLRVRSTPSISGTLLATQPLGTRGVIKGGPVSSGGYTWWNIDYSSGSDGWSADAYLMKDVTGGNPSACFNFIHDLTVGSYLSDMFYLQTALQAEGFSISDSEKTPTPYFGNSTLAAAIGFQRKYTIFPQAGYVGPITRTRLNAIYGCR